MYKTCTKCLETKRLSTFSCTKKNTDGTCKYHNSWCNSCRTAENRKRNGSSQKAKAIITENGKSCLSCNVLKSLTEFSPAKRGKLGFSSYCRLCQPRASKDNARNNTQRYRERHAARYKAAHRLNMLKRRSKIIAVSDDTVTDEFLEFVYSQTICCWCNMPVEESKRTLEHLVELSAGGLHSIFNINMACRSCNSARKNRSGSTGKEGLGLKFIEKEKYE